MEDIQTISWIFLATALASLTTPAKSNSISQIADGINHAVPTQRELQNSMKWLTGRDLISKQGNKYSLTEKGKEVFRDAEAKSELISKIWEELEISLKQLH